MLQIHPPSRYVRLLVKNYLSQNCCGLRLISINCPNSPANIALSLLLNLLLAAPISSFNFAGSKTLLLSHGGRSNISHCMQCALCVLVLCAACACTCSTYVCMCTSVYVLRVCVLCVCVSVCVWCMCTCVHATCVLLMYTKVFYYTSICMYSSVRCFYDKLSHMSLCVLCKYSNPIYKGCQSKNIVGFVNILSPLAITSFKQSNIERLLEMF